MFKESNFQSKRDLIGQCLLSLTEYWASPWIAFANCSLKLRSRNKISPAVYKNESCLWARKLKQVFVHGRRVQIYLKREPRQTFAFNSSRVIHPESFPCLTFLRKIPSKVIYTPLDTRGVCRQMDTQEQSSTQGPAGLPVPREFTEFPSLGSLKLPGNLQSFLPCEHSKSSALCTSWPAWADTMKSQLYHLQHNWTIHSSLTYCPWIKGWSSTFICAA